MDICTLLKLLHYYLSIYWPEQLDESLKPKDSAGDKECRNITFDFIIVGAGTAGCVLANRLSANPKWKVLLIEAGGDEDYITDTPALADQLTGRKYDWNYTTTEQRNACLDHQGCCPFPRGHVMGGTSTINQMLYVRGRPQIYDQWEAIGNPGWNYQTALDYFKKSENMTIEEFANDTIHHSTSGPMPMTYSRWRSKLCVDFMEGGIEQYSTWLIDYNAQKNIGSNYIVSNLKGATRCSTSKAYLDPIKDRSNLYIFKNTLAIKVLFSEKESKRPIGVTCVTNGEQYDVYSSKEVILSAGAIGTAKLLLLSGVGPAKDLEKLGIPVVLDSPVGQNFKDQLLITYNYNANVPELEYDEERFRSVIEEYAKNKTGLLSSQRWLVYARLNATADNELNTLPTTEFINTFNLPPLSTFTKDLTFSDTISLLSPASVGTVTLKSSNYMDPPLINPNYFSNSYDIRIATDSLNDAAKYVSIPRLRQYSPKFIAPPQCGDVPEKFNIEYTKCYVKYNVIAGTNPSGTAKMGPKSDKTSVVDSTLSVRNLVGVRVIDASVIPIPPKANLFATELMVAERAADLIQHKYTCTKNS